MRWSVAFFSLMVFAGPSRAEDLTPSPEEFADGLRSLLLQHLPVPLIADDSDWGQQTEVANGIYWERRGWIRHRPHIVRKEKNHGVWRKVRVIVDNPAQTLLLAVRDFRSPQQGVTTFELWCAFPCHIYYDQQNWRSGIRLYSGSARARCRVAVRLNCEATTRFETTSDGLPDLVARFRITEADLHYDQFQVEHLFGIGGDGAKILGDAARDFLDRRRPELQRELLEQANAAIVKAGDTKEIRLSFSRLFP